MIETSLPFLHSINYFASQRWSEEELGALNFDAYPKVRCKSSGAVTKSFLSIIRCRRTSLRSASSRSPFSALRASKRSFLHRPDSSRLLWGKDTPPSRFYRSKCRTMRDQKDGTSDSSVTPYRHCMWEKCSY